MRSYLINLKTPDSLHLRAGYFVLTYEPEDNRLQLCRDIHYTAGNEPEPGKPISRYVLAQWKDVHTDIDAGIEWVGKRPLELEPADRARFDLLVCLGYQLIADKYFIIAGENRETA